MQSGDNFELITSIADKLNAAIGISRAAVDAGYTMIIKLDKLQLLFLTCILQLGFLGLFNI